jgi:hypothetical protein
MNPFHWAHSTFSIFSGGCCSLLWLLFTIYAIVNIISSRASAGAKVVWIVLMFLLPVVGPLLWLVVGPRQYGY